MVTAIAEQTASARASVPRTVIYTDLYDLIAAVQESLEPGEEAYVTPIVTHLLRDGHAHWLRDVEITAL